MRMETASFKKSPVRSAGARMDPNQLKEKLSRGLLSFPVTDFTTDGEFDAVGYRGRLEWLQGYGASALFVAGGTGEGFSLTADEHRAVVATAVEACGRTTPVVAGVGRGTRDAVALAQQAEAAGAAGVLLMPHYLTDASQEGLIRHVKSVCQSVGIGLIVYNRGVCRLTAASLDKLVAECPNLVGVKDGHGDIELLTEIRMTLGERVICLGGMPTAEIYATAYHAVGVPTYSSAVFNFIPRTALVFHAALRAGDSATTERLLRDFFLPYVAVRNRGPGYAVSIVKAGARLVDRSAGPVRPPLVDCTEQDHEDLRRLLEALDE